MIIRFFIKNNELVCTERQDGIENSLHAIDKYDYYCYFNTESNYSMWRNNKLGLMKEENIPEKLLKRIALEMILEGN